MAIRDLIVLSVVFVSLPVCLTRPWIGILVFSWLGYMNPHKYAWGVAQDFPVALIVAVTTLLGFLITKDKDKFPFEKQTIIILILWVIFTVTSLSAFYPDLAWSMWRKTSKVLLMCLITIPLFIDRKKLKYLFLTIGLSLGFLGLKGAVFTILNAGQWNVRGPDGSFISGEGDFGLALNMTLPILFYLAREEENKKFKMFLYSTFVMSAVSVIFTYRRGAFLGLAAVIFMLALKARKKVIVVGILSVALIVTPFFIPAQWTERMETITTYKQSSSAMGRIYAWQTAFNVAKDRPLTGSGFDGLSSVTIAKYSPSPYDTARDVHSIYFEVLGEHGFPAFGLFILLLLFCFLDLRRIKKATSGVPSAGWIGSYSDMLQVSLIAYMVGGTFLGRAYFDLFYHLVATVVILKVLTQRELSLVHAEHKPVGLSNEFALNATNETS